jgi:hypothetical protein
MDTGELSRVRVAGCGWAQMGGVNTEDDLNRLLVDPGSLHAQRLETSTMLNTMKEVFSFRRGSFRNNLSHISLS